MDQETVRPGNNIRSRSCFDMVSMVGIHMEMSLLILFNIILMDIHKKTVMWEGIDQYSSRHTLAREQTLIRTVR